ncbi:hypothetical protein IFM89_023294 [Coptis chinensis]|uniref:LOW protein: ammonium transporter 1-like protein n=1 Tax=Coptis chinensis TaxID=261450 RepID=A0A835H855_9MAGN|nr:hypothetical protein IFM89_023294 [Coptis chinensis]
MACVLFPPPSNFPSSSLLTFHRNSNHTLSLLSLNKPSKKISIVQKPLTVSFALAESNNSLNNQSAAEPLVQQLADCFVLPLDYFSQLPSDLRLDLNDAAFDLANGRVIDECGQDLGEALLNLSQAWEQADTSTSRSIASKLPSLVLSASDNAKSALGKRLVSSGRRFQSMGQYGQGELQKIAISMIETGKLLSASPVTATDEKSKEETRMFKFGELQVKLTPEKAYIGAGISIVFGILSWELSQGIQSIPETSLQYANDNALLLGKSLRGALLAICYSSTILSTSATVGLILLGRQLQSEEQ